MWQDTFKCHPLHHYNVVSNHLGGWLIFCTVHIYLCKYLLYYRAASQWCCGYETMFTELGVRTVCELVLNEKYYTLCLCWIH